MAGMEITEQDTIDAAAEFYGYQGRGSVSDRVRRCGISEDIGLLAVAWDGAISAAKMSDDTDVRRLGMAVADAAAQAIKEADDVDWNTNE